MGRRPGDRVAGRWTLRSEARGGSDLRRWILEDPSTGEVAEALEPSASARLRPGALDGFRASVASSEPDLGRTLVESVEGPLAIGAPTRGTLADVPALGAAEALDLARWLGPGLVPTRVVPGGRLGPEDLVVDGAGRARRAPTGIPGPGGPLDVPRFTAPEVLAGGSPTEGSALFGLGVLLYQRLTGAWPWPATTAAAWRDALARGTPPAAPSSLSPGLPPELDALLAGLLSPDPGRRVAAVGALGPAAGEPPVLEVAERSAARAETPAAPAPALPALPASGGHLVVADLSRVPASALALASAVTGFDPGALSRAGSRPVVLGRTGDAPSAARLAEQLEALGLPARAMPAPFPTAMVLGGASSLAFMAAAALLVFSRVAAALAAVVGVVLGVIAATRPRAPLTALSHATLHRVPAVAALERRLVGLMARLPGLPLPTPALRDLRDDLHGLLTRTRALQDAGDPALDEVSRIVAEAESTLPEAGTAPDPVDVAAVQRRLALVRATRRELEPPTRPKTSATD